MADQMKATPRSPILGLFSDIVNLPLQYMSAPERTQQMQGTAQFLYGTGIPKTLERMSYGDSLFSGSGMTLRPKEETINAAMNVAPFAPAVGRLASRAIRATEGMPVGMGIKDVGKGITSNISQFTGFKNTTPYGKAKEVAAYLDRLNIPYTINKSKTTNSAYLEIQTGKGDFDYPMQFRFSDHSTDLPHQNRQIFTNPKPDPNFDLDVFKDGGHDTEFAVNKINELAAKINPITTNPKSPYPQQAALDLAQQRAALPVDQGGLGLSANNTAADRAKAMGFDTEAYHSTNASDITKFDLGKSSRGEGTSVALTPENAQAYGNITYPLKVDQQKIFDPTNKNQLSKLKSYVENLIKQQKPYDKDSLSFYPFTSKKVLENLDNPKTGAYYLENEIISKSLKDLGYSGSIGMESGQSQLKIFNPEQIRSRFAAFDPFRKDVATATAMGVAAPDLLAQPVNQYQNPYETLPMYTDPFGNTIGSSIR